MWDGTRRIQAGNEWFSLPRSLANLHTVDRFYSAAILRARIVDLRHSWHGKILPQSLHSSSSSSPPSNRPGNILANFMVRALSFGDLSSLGFGHIAGLLLDRVSKVTRAWHRKNRLSTRYHNSIRIQFYSLDGTQVLRGLG